MPRRKKPTAQKTPSLKEQVVKIGIGVAQILNILPTLATKEEMRREFAGVNQRLARLEETKADKRELQDLKEELKKDIEDLNQHITDILTRYMDSHKQSHDQVEKRLTKLEVT